MEKTAENCMFGLLSYVRAREPDLTHRQLALLFLVSKKQGPHTVRGIAKELNVSKPVITRALDKLTNMGYLVRLPDENDGRNVFIEATSEGAEFLAQFEKFFTIPSQRGSEGTGTPLSNI